MVRQPQSPSKWYLCLYSTKFSGKVGISFSRKVGNTLLVLKKATTKNSQWDFDINWTLREEDKRFIAIRFSNFTFNIIENEPLSVAMINKEIFWSSISNLRSEEIITARRERGLLN